MTYRRVRSRISFSAGVAEASTARRFPLPLLSRRAALTFGFSTMQTVGHNLALPLAPVRTAGLRFGTGGSDSPSRAAHTLSSLTLPRGALLMHRGVGRAAAAGRADAHQANNRGSDMRGDLDAMAERLDRIEAARTPLRAVGKALTAYRA
jgi:hypothetical protein